MEGTEIGQLPVLEGEIRPVNEAKMWASVELRRVLAELGASAWAWKRKKEGHHMSIF